MMKLIRRVAARGLTGLPYLFIGVRALLLTVQIRLQRAFNVFAEFSSLIFDVAIKGHDKLPFNPWIHVVARVIIYAKPSYIKDIPARGKM